MKHVLFLRRYSEGAGWGGAENRVLDYLSNNDYSYNKISLAVTFDFFSEKLHEKNIPVKVILLPFTFTLKSWPRFWKMFHFLKSIKPDKIIFVQGAFSDFQFPDFLAGFLVAPRHIFSLEVLGAPELPQKTSKKHFGLIPGMGLWWYKKIFFYYLRSVLCKRVLSVSYDVSDRLIKWYWFPKNKVVNVYGGVDIKKFDEKNGPGESVRKNLAINGSDTLIISTGRLSKEKCFDRLINAFDILAKNNPNLVLLIVGDGPEKNNLHNLASKKISGKRILFAGFQNKISTFLQASDIFVLASDIEGLGNSLLEAMAVGLVCISTNTPGPHEILGVPNCGFLVDRTEEAIFLALNKAIKLSAEERLEIGKNARQRIMDKFLKEENRKIFFKEVDLVLNH